MAMLNNQRVNYNVIIVIHLIWNKATDLLFGRPPPRKKGSVDLKFAVIWGWFHLLIMISVFGHSEVALICPTKLEIEVAKIDHAQRSSMLPIVPHIGG